MNRLKKFFYNASLLTLTSLFMRGVALAFNVWISNKVGAEALGLFSLISGVYGFALTLATSGISLTVTRMVAEALGHEDDGLVRASMQRCVLYSLFFGFLSAILLFSLSKVIGIHWLDDGRTVLPLRLMSITLPLIALTSCFNGYFTAVRRVAKNALSQVAEQAIKIGATVFLLTSFFPNGIEYACIALVLGGVLSEMLSFAVMSIMYITDKRKNVKNVSTDVNGKTVTKNLLSIALPVAFSTYARSALISVEHALIPVGLRKSGASREHSLAAYGTLTGMVMPVILFPAALIASFSGMTIPEISDCIARGHKNRIRYIAGRVWQFCLMFSVGVSGILICFSSELGMCLYSSRDAGIYIKMLAPLIPIMYLDTTTDALLKGLGQQFYSMNINIIDALLSVFLVWILVPKWGINGYIFVIISMEVLNFGLSATRMLNISGLKPKFFVWLFKPIICIIASTVFTKKLFTVGSTATPMWLSLTLHITAAALLYFVFLSVTKTFTREDGTWLAGLFKGK